jgi:hypothetical protein
MLRVVIIGNPPGHLSDRRLLAEIVVRGRALVITSSVPPIRVDVQSLVNRQLAGPGFSYRTGRYTPSPEDPQDHTTFLVQQHPGDQYFGAAVKDTLRIWNGASVGGFEINGFASYVEEIP